MRASDIVKSRDWYTPRRTSVFEKRVRCSREEIRDTYDNIHGLVQIDDHTVVVDNWDGGDGTFGEHVNDIEDGRFQGCCGYRPVRIGRVGCLWWKISRDIGADLKFTEGKVEVLYFSGTLEKKGEGVQHETEMKDTLMAMNLRRRYWVKTETMTSWPVSVS